MTSKDMLVNQKLEEKAEKAQQQQQEDSTGWGGGHILYMCGRGLDVHLCRHM